MKLVYPAIFYKEDNNYIAEIPDLNNNSTFGETLVEVIDMATDMANGYIVTLLDCNDEIPKPTEIANLKCDKKGSFINYILVDTDGFKKRYREND